MKFVDADEVNLFRPRANESEKRTRVSVGDLTVRFRCHVRVQVIHSCVPDMLTVFRMLFSVRTENFTHNLALILEVQIASSVSPKNSRNHRFLLRMIVCICKRSLLFIICFGFSIRLKMLNSFMFN